MTICVECDECGRDFRFSDKLAGRRVRCKDCDNTIEVPGGRSRSSRPRSEPSRSRSRDSNRRSQSRPAPRRKSAVDTGRVKNALIIGGLVLGGFAVVGGIGMFAMKAFSSFGKSGSQVADAGSGGNKSGSGRSLESVAENLVEDDHSVIIFVVGAEGEHASDYLSRKINAQANQVLWNHQKQVENKNQRNKKAAEEKARASGQIMYRYEEEDREYSYKSVMYAGKENNTYAFTATPADNPRRFAESLEVGNITKVDGIKVYIQSTLPNPVPDPDVEAMQKKYGADKVFTVVLYDAVGNDIDVRNFVTVRIARIKEQLQGRPPNYNYTMTSFVQHSALSQWEKTGDGTYQFIMGTEDPSQIAAALDFGAAKVDYDNRRILVTTALPSPIPTLASMETERQKIKEVEDAKQAVAQQEATKRYEDAAKARAADSANRAADRENRPRDGETKYDWAIRVLTEDSHFSIEPVLTALAKMEVKEEHQLEIAKLLGKSFGDHSYPLDKLLPAFKTWCPEDKYGPTLIQWFHSTRHRIDDQLLTALSAVKTENAAKALVTKLGDFFMGDKCVQPLIDMGPVAEPAVLIAARNNDNDIRHQAYRVLAAIGGEKTMVVLRKNLKTEVGNMRVSAKECMDLVKDRVNAAKEKEADMEKSDA